MNCMNQLRQPKGVCPHCGFDNAACENDAHQLECGSILAGSFLVGRVLGQGGFGITYVGWDLNLEIKVAIKEYYPEGCVTRDTHTHVSVLTYAGSKEAFFQKGKERFVGEARALAKYSGDSAVVGVRTFFYENGTAYIVMDFVEGETLKAYAARLGGKLPAPQVLSLFQPLIRAIARVHESGLLHRDISPDNIMLRSDGTLALLDFGAARQISVAGEHSNTINVKHGFAPEEQYRTRGEQGPWTDVYALCATIYRLTTGVTPTEALDRIVNDEPLAPPSAYGANFTPEQEAALMHGLALRANERIQSMQELAADLFQAGETDMSFAHSTQQSQNAAAFAKDALKETGAKPHTTGGAAQKSNSEPTERNADAGNAKPKKKIETILSGAAALVAVVIIAATVIQHQTQQNELQQVADEIDAKNYTSALSIAEDIGLKNEDYDAAIYDYAQELIDQGEPEAAETMKNFIADTSEFDMIPLEDGIAIERIREYLASGEYRQAEATLSQIQQPGSYNLKEIRVGIATLKIDALIKNQSGQEAFTELKNLEKIDQSAADNLFYKYTDEFYDYAVSLYHKGDFSGAEPVFWRLGDYQRTSDYNLLIDCSKKAASDDLYWMFSDGSENSETKAQLEALATIADFENAGELLLTNSSTAFLFLLGQWSGGPSYIKFYISNGSWWGRWQMTGFPSGHWDIRNSDFYVTDSKGVEKKIARFTVLGQDSIEIFLYASERTYNLVRG